MDPHTAHMEFKDQFAAALEQAAKDPEVVGFKSIACYRTGLDVSVRLEETFEFSSQVLQCVTMAWLKYQVTHEIRLEYKDLNDCVVNATLHVAAECGKSGESHK